MMNYPGGCCNELASISNNAVLAISIYRVSQPSLTLYMLGAYVYLQAKKPSVSPYVRRMVDGQLRHDAAVGEERPSPPNLGRSDSGVA